jgi:DNA repair protein RadC
MKSKQLEMFTDNVKFVRCQFVSEGGPVATLRTPEDAFNTHKRDVAQRPEYDSEVEQFIVLMLDTRNTIRAAHIVSKGTLNASLIHAREVFRSAIAANAAAVILMHNHPSGNVSPSPEDLKCTRDLIAAGKVIGIKVLDHVIVSDQPLPPGQIYNFLSLRESGLVSFEG